jgi:hypothetical protein
MTRPLSVIVVSLLVLSSLLAGVTTVTAAEPAVQISSVSVSTENPTIGETVTVDTTISNLQQTNGTVEITDVYIRTSGTPTTHERIEDVGAVAPGGSLTVPVRTSFSEAGEKRLSVHVTVRDQAGDYYSYSYPLTVNVEEPVVKGGLSTSANDTGQTTVTLTNYGNVEFTDVAISARSNSEIRDQQYTFDIAPGERRSVTFDTQDYRRENVTFTATYTANSETHEIVRTATLEQQVTGENPSHQHRNRTERLNCHA